MFKRIFAYSNINNEINKSDPAIYQNIFPIYLTDEDKIQTDEFLTEHLHLISTIVKHFE